MERVLRDGFIFLSQNKTLNGLAKRYGLKFGAGRFVAGDSLEASKRAIQDLNSKGLCVTMDHLGEFISTVAEAEMMTQECIRAVEMIAEEKLDSQLSLKLTSLGLDISDELIRSNMERILTRAKEVGVFVTIDMEDEPRCEKTIQLFEELRQSFDNIGTVIQSYLYRSEDDIKRVGRFETNLRIVKGAYKEPATVAFPEKEDVDHNYIKLVKLQLSLGNYAAVATHDDAMIEQIIRYAKENGIGNDKFELQMLYGIRVERQLELVKLGYKVRVYVPYGRDWYGYFMRRLAERPANVAFVLKGMVKG
ncbi:proline dehydrogenase [Exiguobacterium sp. PvP048]|uniref:proline dehydrogenase n=1 Tax=unclassified Exiguobacterium TaxID=2644629 RepID=UPI00339176CC